MSNLESAPAELACTASGLDGIEVLRPREVPLGGPRALRVRRTLPQRHRSLIGAWCFADHYGPHDVRDSAGMDVPPHPHTGLQTVSWLFHGEIEHRDSAGVHQLVRPGELNLMTAGAGICHSEVSTASTTILHGVQLWVALPDSGRNTARDFDHFVPEPVSLDGATVRVFLGELGGERSPVHTFTPLLGAQVDLAAGARVELAGCRLESRKHATDDEFEGRGLAFILVPEGLAATRSPPTPSGYCKACGPASGVPPLS
jgi:quercetin 2,3-dioxygenase